MVKEEKTVQKDHSSFDTQPTKKIFKLTRKQEKKVKRIIQWEKCAQAKIISVD